MDFYDHTSLDQAKKEADDFAKISVQIHIPTAYEVVKLPKGYRVQPFGMSLTRKNQKLVYVAPIPKD